MTDFCIVSSITIAALHNRATSEMVTVIDQTTYQMYVAAICTYEMAKHLKYNSTI